MAIPSLQEIIPLSKTALTIEAQEKILELRQAALDLQEQNLNLRDQLRAVQDQLTLRALTFRHGVYWDGDDDRNPFCPRCADADQKRVRLHSYDSMGLHDLICRNCKNTFLDKSLTP
jgi:hypothetical protein